MPSLLAAITALTLGGTPGHVAYTDTAAAEVPRPGSLDFTRLSPNGSPFKKRTDFSSKTELLDIAVETDDIAYISATESPNDSQEIVTYDSVSVSVSESLAIARQIAVTDTARLSLSEVISLSVTGVGTYAVTDTASLSVTDASAIAVTLDVTDTASVSVTESSTVAQTSESKSVTDTASLTASDSATVNIFTGVLDLHVSDIWTVAMSEVAYREDARYVSRIMFRQSMPRILFRKV